MIAQLDTQETMQEQVLDSQWPRVPRPYQQLVIDFRLQTKNNLDGSAPGLGKTLATSIAATEAANRIRQAAPLTWTHISPVRLVICPTHLMKMWFSHIDKQHPEATISMCNSTQPDGRVSTKEQRLWALRPGFDWYIINYQALRSDDYFEALKKLPICILILDESHNVKSPKAVQSKRVYELSRLPTCEYRFLLTATPIKREADDLFFQLHIIDPYMFHSEREFTRVFCMADYTQYGARNVRLRKEYAERLYYNIPRKACASDKNLRWKEAGKQYDWQTRTYKEIPAEQPCICLEMGKDAPCAPYQFNIVRDSVRLPDPPKPAVNKLIIDIADWLKDHKQVDSVEQLESTASFKRRKPLAIRSAYQPPEPQYEIKESINPMSKIIGFSYADVGMYLPKVVPAQIIVPMDVATREMYESVKRSWRATFPDLGVVDLGSAMAALHTIRVLTCCEPKLEALQETIESEPDEGHLVFCFYEMTAQRVAEYLGIPGQHIAAHIPAGERSDYAKNLIEKGLPVVTTLQVLNEGVDLSDIRFCHFFEEDWTPGVQYQALSREQRNPTSFIKRQCKECQHDLSDHEGAPGTFACQHADCSCQDFTGLPVIANYYWVENSIDQHIHSINQNRAMNARDLLKIELAMD